MSTNFIQDLLYGSADPSDIEEYIDRWHESDVESLSEYLGISEQEYAEWANQPYKLRDSKLLEIAKRYQENKTARCNIDVYQKLKQTYMAKYATVPTKEKEVEKQELETFRKEAPIFPSKGLADFEKLEEEVEKAKDIGKDVQGRLQEILYSIKVAHEYFTQRTAECPKKVKEIADAIRRDNPDVSDEVAYRMAYENYCSYINPDHEGCTSKGKSERKSPKPYE